ncbi:MAG TPA: maleylpyruvate isomerase N-terminal domain-containing protein [Actinomycetota bacterium]|nr:maleylpyruvate isomerase N-terminal domain-containing protein [Actinomycetota bacterium]
MQPAYDAALLREGEAFAAAAQMGLDLPVPSCPGWSVAELTWHLGRVHRHWEERVRLRLQEQAGLTEVERPPHRELVPWFRDGLERLSQALRGADPGERIWTWARQQDVGFVRRRMAQETVVHRVDAQLAAGSFEPIEPVLAADGVDEFLDVMLGEDEERLREGTETIHLHATDIEAEWLVEVADGRLTNRHEHGRGEAAARASASGLLLLLWRRIAPDRVEVLGDRSVLRRFLARADLG